MAKKQKATAPVQIPEPQHPVASTASGKVQTEKKEWSITDFKVQALILAIIGLVFYFNTFFNEYALDDRPMIIENEYVKSGIAGIPKILTTDAFSSYLNQQHSGNALTGGRYRPLSIVTFAIEQSILGLPGNELAEQNATQPNSNMITPEAAAKRKSDMHVRHMVNVLLYILSVVTLLSFLRKIVFPGNPIIPFAAALIFLIHPIHTEVVANVKSRDEILSLLFISLTFIYSFRYIDERKRNDLVKGMLCFFAALLSKEYALALVFLLPLSFYLFRKQQLQQAFTGFLPFIAPFALYMLMRISSVAKNDNGLPAADDIMNIPYLFATPVQHFASVISVLFYYFRLLVFPHPLSSDYSYYQLPYRDLSYPLFWVSLLFHLFLVGALLYTFRKKHILCFAIATYLLNLGMVGNIVFNIGAPMGERLIFHSSVGFSIVVAYFLYNGLQKVQPGKAGITALFTIIGVLSVPAAIKTIARNKEWKNDKTLFLTDVKTSPNSVLILGNAGSACIDLADDEKDSVKQRQFYNEGVKYLSRAVKINPKFSNGFQNRGVALYKLGYTDSAVANWDTVRKYYPASPLLPYVLSIASNYYYRDGIKFGKANQHAEAAACFAKAAHVNPTDGDVWYNLGFASMNSGNYKVAVAAFRKSLLFQTKNRNAQTYLAQSEARLAMDSIQAQAPNSGVR